VRYRTLGKSGVQVSELCLGAMMFGAWGNPDERECHQIVCSALDAGINFIDTADVYSSGASEEIVGRAIKGRRDAVVLATKFHSRMGDQPNMGGSSRRWIMRAVEASLRRLGTDWIDLYQAHRPDPTCVIEETLDAASDLVRQGKVRMLGLSNFPAEQIVEACWAVERRRTARVWANQCAYSLFVRGPERDVLPTCQRQQMSVLAWSPLNGGWLAGRYRRSEPPAAGSRATRGRTPERYDRDRPGNARKLELLLRIEEVAQAAGCTLPELSIAWVLVHPAVTSALIGPRTLDQLRGVLRAADVTLTDPLLDRLDEIVAPGTVLNAADTGWSPPALETTARRPGTVGP
jgi:aryl-alcohol dehydrogenase-like predicted oxidoreductase